MTLPSMCICLLGSVLAARQCFASFRTASGRSHADCFDGNGKDYKAPLRIDRYITDIAVLLD